MEESKYLYKFMPFNKNSLLVLINHELYFADPNTLNDPIDCVYNIKVRNLPRLKESDIISLVNKYRSILTWNGDLEDVQIAKDCLDDPRLLLKLLLHKIKEDSKSKIGVCSFSTDFKYQGLWSHYAESSKGLCFVFNKEVLLSKIKLNTGQTDVLLRRYYGGLIDYSGNPYELEIKNNEFNIDYNYYLKKTNAWSIENEFRLILIADGGMYDYSTYEKNRFLILPEGAIAGIMLGERTTSFEFNTLRNLCSKLRYKIFTKKISRDIETGDLNY